MGINYIINNIIIRLIRLLVNNGYSDIIIKIENEEIPSIKCLLCYQNQIFKQLIEDGLFDGTLELFEGCTKNGFLALESFYSGGKVEINESNCIDILKICFCYNERILLKECEKFIIRHKNIKLFNTISKEIIMKCNYLSELDGLLIDYMTIEKYLNKIDKEFSDVLLKYYMKNNLIYIDSI